MSKNTLAEQLEKLPVSNCLLMDVVGYKNKQGSVTNYTINAGMSYAQAAELDEEFLKNWEPSASDIKEFGEILKKVGKTPTKSIKEHLLDAKEALLSSLRKETQETRNRSEGQINAYKNRGNVLKEHIESGDILLRGLLVEKEVVIEGPTKKQPNSGVPVRAKKFISNNYLKTGNVVQFNLNQLQTAFLSDDRTKIIIQ